MGWVTMNHKIQIFVDDELNALIRDGAHEMGLSISSYARLVLLSVLPKKKMGLLSQAMQDVEKGKIQPTNLERFKQQLDEL
jgi:hypothetical protein